MNTTTTAPPAIKIRALDSHIKELANFQSEDSIPKNDAFNFYRGTIQDNSTESNNLKAIATKFLNGFTSGNTTTFESAYNAVVSTAPAAPAAAHAHAPAAAPAAAAAAAAAGGGRTGAVGGG